MNYELLEALNQIAREKNVDREVLVETLIAGLLSAARKRYGLSANIDVHFDRDRGRIEAKLIRHVVSQVEDESLEVSLEDAREADSKMKIGSEFHTELDIQEFGRGAVTAAKQVLIQRVREAEREKVYEEFQDRVGELVRGVVQQVDRRNVLVRVDRTEAILPEREALHRDRFCQGEHITAMVLEVDRQAKGPQVILTRSRPDFLRRLFESEVPEINEKIVEVRSIAREPGSRSKVAVFSHDDRVDAVGACVGVKGSRVQNIVRELGGERIDIVPWSSDPALFVTRALSPAKVQRVDVDEENGSVTVVVVDDQLSLAIGKGGQNVRLAMKLSGWSIDLVSEGQAAEKRALEEIADFDLEGISDRLGPKLTERLIQAGLETARDILHTTPEALQAIEGVGPKSAEKALANVRECYEEKVEAYRQEREAARALEAAKAEDLEDDEEEELETVDATGADGQDAAPQEADEGDGVSLAEDEVAEDDSPETESSADTDVSEPASETETDADAGDEEEAVATAAGRVAGADERDEGDVSESVGAAEETKREGS